MTRHGKPGSALGRAGLTQLAAPTAGQPRKKGRGGSATTPAGASALKERKARAAQPADGGKKGGGGGGRSGATRAVRKPSAPKRKNLATSPSISQAEGVEGSERSDQDQLADELLLPAAAAARRQQRRQQVVQEEDEGEEAPPAAAAAAAPPQQRGPPPNAPAGAAAGPGEDLVVDLDESGGHWVGGTEGEPHLTLAVPANINRYLRSYQREGIRFLMSP
ncbi:hypothetical protein C2E20_2531 [Micractinium conductrix]|uniref:Uncharacterized protein n=1 Tax=Micractinium conductrix TaxID=554055 RepID=A0A2P6VIS6_9CHLO|nr:hypothetical protein C2E20_2531 [Micractinium conductrix]|eukprot:PSC73957.1 hypothetical protein C2E20_2531 [Micractinium conductrix]